MLATTARCCALLSMVLLASCLGANSQYSAAEEIFVNGISQIHQPSNNTMWQVQPDATAQWIEVVSWQPRAFIYHNFLTDQEAEHIKRLAAATMKRSTVVSSSGESVLDEARTSYGTFIKRNADSIISAVEERIAAWVQIPTINAEDMQVLRYGLGQEYKPHMDSGTELEAMAEEAGPRVATVLLYLNDVPAGGETAFPDSNNWADSSLPDRLGPFSSCAEGSVAFRPKKGDAFLFWSVTPKGALDPASMHTGCPVLEGVKWTATKWFHGQEYRPEEYYDTAPDESIDPGFCEDFDDNCNEYAVNGACEEYKAFMLGDMKSPGSCRRACGACTVCAEGDKQCYDENRRKAGYLVFDESELDSDDSTAAQGATCNL